MWKGRMKEKGMSEEREGTGSVTAMLLLSVISPFFAESWKKKIESRKKNFIVDSFTSRKTTSL